MQSTDFTGGLESEELTLCAILSVLHIHLPCDIHTLGRQRDREVGDC